TDATIVTATGSGVDGVRSYGGAPERVDASNRAAAGADLHHLDDGNAKRQAASSLEAIDPRHLEDSACLWLRSVDETELRGGAAHVGGEHALEPALARGGAPEKG